MKLTPATCVRAAQLGVAAGAALLLVVLLGPYQGAEHIVHLSDKAAHAIAFYGLTLLAFLALPRSRRADLAIAAVILAALTEAAQAAVGRDGDMFDWMADSVGVLAVWAPGQIERWRDLARRYPNESFRAIAWRDQRRRERDLITAPLVQEAASATNVVRLAPVPKG